MKTNYLDDRWSEITRDERYFCAELFHIIKENKAPFNELLSEKGIINSVDVDYEIGYEVCFYRDYICKYGYKNNTSIKTIKDKNGKFMFPQKRTFDLCLFLKDEIIIIEAKAQQGFSTNQLKEFNDDRALITALLGADKGVNIKIIGLYSSEYKPKKNLNYNESDNTSGKKKTLNYFDGEITWKEIQEKYQTHTKILDRADNIYKEKCYKQIKKKDYQTDLDYYEEDQYRTEDIQYDTEEAQRESEEDTRKAIEKAKKNKSREKSE